jgi:hypothetical protein
VDSLSAHKRHNRSHTSCKWTPALEALEDRQLLAVSIPAPVGGVLTITGDGAADQVYVLQNDASDDLTVQVVGPGGFTNVYASSLIDKIVAKMGGGNDQFTFDLGDSDFTEAKVIKLDLGAGDDKARFHLHKDSTSPTQPAGPLLDANLEISIGQTDADIPSPDKTGNDQVWLNIGRVLDGGGDLSLVARLGAGEDRFYGAFWQMISGDVSLDVDGGGNKDTLKVGVASYIFPSSMTAPQSFFIPLAGDIDVALEGGGGNDDIGVRYKGHLEGDLTVTAHGGGGKDNLWGRFETQTVLDDDFSDGNLDVQFFGDEGNDWMSLRILDAGAHLNLVNALLDGGKDADKWGTPLTTANVTKLNFEGTFFALDL